VAGVEPPAGADPVRVNRATYDEIAPAYRQRAGDVWDQLRVAVRTFTEALPVAGGTTASPGAAGAGALDGAGWVADVGCGPGRDTALLRAAGLRVLGLDLSLGMLRTGGLPCVVQADMRALPLGNGVLSGVWCNAAFLHIPLASAPVVLAEFARVVRPGGALYLAVAEGDGERWEDTRSEGRPRFFAYHRQPALARQVERAGFAVRDTGRGPATASGSSSTPCVPADVCFAAAGRSHAGSTRATGHHRVVGSALSACVWCRQTCRV
jgi:SAM-dependent methyltransferase